uniref:Chitin-binding type-2 domain-containing protein n=1 Tax=Stomoxys calcitrans TaxID=35570 RepID=A0A1I8PVK9_STOCA
MGAPAFFNPAFVLLLAFVFVVPTFALPENTFDPDELCPLIAYGTKIKDPNYCHVYIECRSDTSTSFSCRQSEWFERNRGKCVRKGTIKCLSSQPCWGQHDIFVADPYSCQRYFYCENGEGVQRHCQDGSMFNPNSRKCDSNYRCKITLLPEDYCNIVPDGVHIKDPLTNDGYHTCRNSKMHYEKCKKDHEFNAAKGKCEKAKKPEKPETTTQRPESTDTQPPTTEKTTEEPGSTEHPSTTIEPETTETVTTEQETTRATETETPSTSVATQTTEDPETTEEPQTTHTTELPTETPEPETTTEEPATTEKPTQTTTLEPSESTENPNSTEEPPTTEGSGTTNGTTETTQEPELTESTVNPETTTTANTTTQDPSTESPETDPTSTGQPNTTPEPETTQPTETTTTPEESETTTQEPEVTESTVNPETTTTADATTQDTSTESPETEPTSTGQPNTTPEPETTQPPEITTTTNPEIPNEVKCLEHDVFISDGQSCDGYYYCMMTQTGEFQMQYGRCNPERFFTPENGGACLLRSNVRCPYNRCIDMGIDHMQMANIDGDGCRGFSLCQDGREIGTNVCPNGFYFDEVKQRCTDEVVSYVACAKND